MKAKLNFLVCMLIFVTALEARIVSVNEAKAVASNFASTVPQFGNSKNILVNEVVIHAGLNHSNGLQPTFYIFNININEGFIIVSATTNLKPVLAYSWDNSFDANEIPNFITEQLLSYTNKATLAEQQQVLKDSLADVLWQQYSVSSGNNNATLSNVQLLKTGWGVDGGLYNYNFPGTEVAPDMAVAIAQVCKYYQFPDCGMGNITLGSKYGILASRMANATYNYSLMPNKLTNTTSSTQVLEVSKLIYHSFLALHDQTRPMVVKNGLDGIINAFQNHLNFNVKMNPPGVDSASYKAFLKGEIAQGRPVIINKYGILNNYIIDGYDYYNNYHINWCSGSFNGFYSDPKFNAQNDIYYDIYPLNKIYSSYKLASSIKIPAVLQTGAPCTFTVAVENFGSSTIMERFELHAYSHSNVYMGRIGVILTTIPAGGIKTLTFQNSKLNLIPGKYKVSVILQNPKNYLGLYKGSYSNDVPIQVQSLNTIKLVSDITISPSRLVRQWGPWYKDNLVVTAKIKNVGTQTFNGQVAASLVIHNQTLIEDIHIGNITIPPGATINVTFKKTKLQNIQLANSVYDVAIYTKESNKTYWSNVGVVSGSQYSAFKHIGIYSENPFVSPEYKVDLSQEQTNETSADDNSFTIFPSPASNTINLNFDKPIELISDLQILNLNGVVVKEVKSHALTNNQIDVSELANGIYFVSLTTNNKKTVKRFVKI